MHLLNSNFLPRAFTFCFLCLGILLTAAPASAALIILPPPNATNPAIISICTMINQIYTIKNGAAGGNYTWSFSTLASPNPFAIAGSGTRKERGVFSGSLKTVPPGNYTVTINVTESPSGATASINRTFKVIDDAISWTANSPVNLSRAVQGVNYVGKVGIKGGRPPYKYSLTGGSLPATLSLNSTTGEIKGMPTDACSSFSFTISANDTCTGTTINRTFTLPIACPLTVNGTSTINATMCTPKTPECYTASGGTPPYTWSPTRPVAGLIITVSGTGNDTLCISGTPNLPGNHSITLIATDSSSPKKLSASKKVTIKIPKAATLTWPTCSALPDGLNDTAYSATLSACFASVNGGVSPYTFAIKSGLLPTGCILDLITGDITGTPTTPGTFNFTIEVTDACGKKLTKLFTIVVEDKPAGPPPADCSGRVTVVQICNSNSARDDNFDIVLNGTKIGDVDLGHDAQVGSLFIAHPTAVVTTGDFDCPVSAMVVHRFDPAIAYLGANSLNMNNIRNNGNSNYGVVQIRSYRLTGSTLDDPQVITNLTYGPAASGLSFSFNFTYTCPSATPVPLSMTLKGGAQTCLVDPYFYLQSVSAKDLLNEDHLVTAPFTIGKTEVTNEEYCVFLNAVAKKSDPRGLYNSAMGTSSNGGIFRSGKAGAYSYAVKSGMGNYPVVYVSWFDAARYVNWLSNGSPTSLQDKTTTEDGAYALNGATSGVSIVRNAMNPNTKNQPTKSLLNESEWFTSAYLKPSKLTSVSFWNYPTQSDTAPDITLANPNNLANYDNIFTGPTETGFFSESLGTFGTLDQGGNVREWTESADSGKYRIIRGGSWSDAANAMTASESDIADPVLEDDKTGFRIGGAP